MILYKAILLAIPAALIAMIVLSLIKNSFKLRFGTVLLLQFFLIMRELGIAARARTLIEKSINSQYGVGEFTDGVRALQIYCDSSSYVLYGTAIAVLIICYRAFPRTRTLKHDTSK